MYESTIAIYSFVDDLLKALNHKTDVRQQVSDAQVITVALVAALHFGGNFEKANFVLSEFGWFSKRLSRSRYSRWLRALQDLLQILFHRIGAYFKDLNFCSRYLLDSFPVSVCDNIRINRCRLTGSAVDKESYRGKVTSKRRYFYGVRCQLLTTETGLPVEIAILPGACSDLQGIAELAMDLPKGSQVFLDAGYTEYNFEDFLKDEEIHLMIGRKKNSKRTDFPAIADFKQLMRKFIETIIGEIEKLFPKKGLHLFCERYHFGLIDDLIKNN